MHQQQAAAKAPAPGLQAAGDGHAYQRHGQHGLRAAGIQVRNLGRDQHIGQKSHGRGRMLRRQNSQSPPRQLIAGGIQQIRRSATCR